MSPVPLAIHERLGVWARQLRPRLAGRPVRLVETRSAADLEAALAGTACPVVLLDLGDRPRAGLGDLLAAALVAPEALILVLDPASRPGLAALARELGASLVLAGVATPPVVLGLLEHWLPLAVRRAEAAGWAGDPGHEPGALGKLGKMK